MKPHKKKLILKACQESIDHHKENQAYPLNAKIGPEHCSLCHMFWTYDCTDDDDRPCPVSSLIGFAGCEFTPYESVEVFHGFRNGSESGRRQYVEAERKKVVFLEKVKKYVESGDYETDFEWEEDEDQAL